MDNIMQSKKLMWRFRTILEAYQDLARLMGTGIPTHIEMVLAESYSNVCLDMDKYLDATRTHPSSLDEFLEKPKI